MSDTELLQFAIRHVLGLPSDQAEACFRMWKSGAKEKLHIAHMVIDGMDLAGFTAMAVTEFGGIWIVRFQNGSGTYKAGEGAFPLAVLMAARNCFPAEG